MGDGLLDRDLGQRCPRRAAERAARCGQDDPGQAGMGRGVGQALAVDPRLGGRQTLEYRVVLAVDRHDGRAAVARSRHQRSEEHTSELQSLMRISYAVFCLNKKKQKKPSTHYRHNTLESST